MVYAVFLAEDVGSERPQELSGAPQPAHISAQGSQSLRVPLQFKCLGWMESFSS